MIVPALQQPALEFIARHVEEDGEVEERRKADHGASSSSR